MKKLICIIVLFASLFFGNVWATRGVENDVHLPPPAAEIYDGFDGTLENWEVVIENGATWSIVDDGTNRYLTSGAVDTWGDDKETLVVSTYEIASDNYSVAFSVNDERYGAMASLVFKYTSPQHFYSLRMLNIDNVDYIGFYRRNGVTLWQEDILTVAEFPGGIRTPGKEFEIKVEVRGNHFYGYVDGELVTEYIEDKPYFDGNRVGIFQSYGYPAYDDFYIYDLDKVEDEEFTYNRHLLATLDLLWDGGENSEADDFVTRAQFCEFLNNIVPLADKVNEDFVTYEDVLDSLMSFMGYDSIDKSSAYYDVCEKLLNGVSATNGNITFADFAQMMVNAFDVDIVKRDYEKNDRFVIAKGETLLSEYRHVLSDSAVLSDNGITALDGRTKLTKGYIAFDNGLKVKTDDSHISELLGYNIRYYVYDDGDVPYLMWYRTEDAKDTYICSEEIISYANGTLSYKKRDDEKVQKIKIPSSANIIYNGKRVNNLQDYMFIMDSGDVTLIDNDSSGGVDVVSIMNYEDIVVKRIDVDNMKVFHRYTNEYVSWKDSEHTKFYRSNFDIESAENVLPGDVLSIARSVDGEVYTFLISRNKVSGMVERIDNQYDVAYIDGKKIPLSADFYNNSYISPGDTGTMHLNADGTGVYFVHDKESLFTVAYMIDCDVPDYGLDHRVKVQLFDGELKVIPCAETLKVDDLVYRRNSSFSALDGYVDIFEYKLNANGEISYIRFPREDNIDSNSKNLAHMGGYIGGTYYKSETRSFSGFLLADQNVKVFLVPLDRTRTDAYRMADITYFKNDVMYYSLAGYSRGGNIETAEFIVSEFDTYPQYLLGTACIVEGIADVLKENGESAKMITVRHDGGESLSLVLAEYCGLEGVEKGDVIQYSVNLSGEVHAILPVFDCSDEILYHYGDTYYTASYRMVYGVVGELKNNSFVFYRIDGGTEIVTLGCPIVVFDSSSRNASVFAGTREDIKDYEDYGLDADVMLIRFEYGIPREMIIYR